MKKATVVFSLTILALLALAQASYPLQITRLETKDFEGVPKTSFRRGEIVVIETTIEGVPTYYFITPIEYLEIVTIWYGNSMMGLLLTRTSITFGETKTFGGGVGIRLTDPIGTYSIEVYVWNGFPSEMAERGEPWSPLAEARTTTITITG
ncbi:MAG: hypothetical protein QXY49_07055 [Thermofilaceae archaeon]